MKINSGRIALLWSIFAFLSLAIANSVVSSIIPYKKEPYIMPEQKALPVYYRYKIDKDIFRTEITKEGKAQILANILGVIDSYIEYGREKVKPLNEYRLVSGSGSNGHYQVKVRKANGTELWFDVDKWDGTFYFPKLDPIEHPHPDIPLDAKDFPILLVPLIIAESSFYPHAFNHDSGARGLPQITLIAWKDLVRVYPDRYKKLNYEEDIFKVDIARQAGLDYLNIVLGYIRSYRKQYPNLYPTLDNILIAYNWGIGNLLKFVSGEVKEEDIPSETKDYVNKIRVMFGFPKRFNIEESP